MSLPNLMEYHGPFGGSTGYHGHLIDMLKSGLQKYIRRGETEKAIRCAIDLDLFYNFEPKAKGIRTNMINRLRIISCEEFCWGNPLLFKKIDNEISNWTKFRSLNRIEGVKAIVNIIEILSLVKPVRMISFIRAAYKHGPLYSQILLKYPKLYVDLDDDTKSLDTTSLVKKDDPLIIGKLINKFNYYFTNKSDKSVYWAFKIMNIKEKCSRRYRRTGAEYILWEYLLDYLNLEDSLKKPIEVLFKWYKNNKSEHWMYLINAIMIALEYNKKNITNCLDQYYPSLNIKTVNDSEIGKIVENHKNSLFEIDDYCIDQHTGKGRSKNRGPIHFATIGSFVQDENKEILNKEYKKIYLDLKYITEGKPIPKKLVIKPKKSNKKLKLKIKIKINADKNKDNKLVEYIKLLPRGQLITGKSKKSVYMDKDYVYKGPYSKNEKMYINNTKYSAALKILEEGLNLEGKFRSYLPILEEINDKNGLIYLKFKNVGKKKDYSQIAEIKTTKIQKDVLILPRKTAVNRASDLEEISSDLKIAILQHLYFRYLLNIGDSGDHNILIREDSSDKLIAGIDMEDNRTKDQGNSKLSYLFKKLPSKKQIKLYSECIDKIKIFSKECFTENIIIKLKKINIDTGLISSKIDKFIK